MDAFYKYPRTRHIEGSRLQPGDFDLESVPYKDIAGRFIVVEEKVDGANAGISFEDKGELHLQSRGHYLTGGRRERHFDLFKAWANSHKTRLFQRLGSRYLVFGEWLYAKHTVFYDRLPHYFLEFDVLDTTTGRFLSTRARRDLLDGLPLVPVSVLRQGRAGSLDHLISLVTTSGYKSRDWKENLREAARMEGLPVEKVLRETDDSDVMEGLYIKIEDEYQVIERYKWVRKSFLTAVTDSQTHWLDRPIVPNRLAPGIDLFKG